MTSNANDEMVYNDGVARRNVPNINTEVIMFPTKTVAVVVLASVAITETLPTAVTLHPHVDTQTVTQIVHHSRHAHDIEVVEAEMVPATTVYTTPNPMDALLRQRAEG